MLENVVSSRSVEVELLHTELVDTSQRHFLLRGFTHEGSVRVFAFERMQADRSWMSCSVKADLLMARTYGIPVQDLPALCRDALERQEQQVAGQCLIFTESAMSAHAAARAIELEAAAKRRGAPARPRSQKTNTAFVVRG